MEAAAALSRKEWRVVSDQHSVQNSVNGDLERLKMGQTDERLIYEVQQGREPADVDFCSITIDGGLGEDILQQRLHDVMKQREELQHLEVDLRARLITRSELMEMQARFDSQIKDHLNANVKLQEQVHERENTIHELRRMMDEKEKELAAVRIDHEAVWAKEDLLREQNKELATYRRERDNSEAERGQHIKQIHDLQEHIQEKERQLMEIQEQHRAAQEAVIFKDEQLREAQSWIARVQEIDALQSTTNHSLQAELRERTEQYNQLWLGCQRQFAEMERLHMHTIQQLQLELADARERSGNNSSDTHNSKKDLKDVTHFGQSNGGVLEVSEGGTGGNSGGLANGTAEIVSPFTGNASTQTDHIPGIQMAPQSLLGLPAYLQPGQVAALHPFVIHQQGLPPQSVPSHVGHFHSMPAMSSLQHWQNQQALTEGSQLPNQNQYPSQKPDTGYEYDVSVNGEAIQSEYLDVHASKGLESRSVAPSTNEGQANELTDDSYMVSAQSQISLQQMTSQFHGSLVLNPLEHSSESEVRGTDTSWNHGGDAQSLVPEQLNLAAKIPEAPINTVNASEPAKSMGTDSDPAEGFASTGKNSTVSAGKTSEIPLLDEESLLACIVRTIPPGSGGKIRISSTLPNRLAKMLAPLHWHDYKRRHGKLDDFVASHPELFVIEGDYIQLREGAQEIIAATAARAKVRAAAATSAHSSSLLPSVAVTPMAHTNRLKKAPSLDSGTGKVEKSMSKDTQLLATQNHHLNGVSLTAVAGATSIKILSKPNDQVELNGRESRTINSSGPSPIGNGANPVRSEMAYSQNRSLNHGKQRANVHGKQQGRSTGAPPNSRS